MYRGTTPEGKVVEGYLGTGWTPSSGYEEIGFFISWINENKVFCEEEVLPSSLAISTGITDKNKVPIYSSFPVDGEVMSEGGDRILYPWAGGTYSKGVIEYKAYDYSSTHGSTVVYPMRFICVTSGDDENGPEINFDSRCEVIPKQETE